MVSTDTSDNLSSYLHVCVFGVDLHSLSGGFVAKQFCFPGTLHNAMLKNKMISILIIFSSFTLRQLALRSESAWTRDLSDI